MTLVDTILHAVWQNVPGFIETRKKSMSNYIYDEFEFTDCDGNTHDRNEFIKRFLGDEKGKNEFPQITYTQMVHSPINVKILTQKRTYPFNYDYETEMIIEPYFLFDTEISGIDGRVGFASRLAGKYSEFFVLDKVIQYNCSSVNNGSILFKNYAHQIKVQRFFNNIKTSAEPASYFDNEFTLYFCANEKIKKPIETFFKNVTNGLKVINVQATYFS